MKNPQWYYLRVGENTPTPRLELLVNSQVLLDYGSISINDGFVQRRMRQFNFTSFHGNLSGPVFGFNEIIRLWRE